MSTGANLRPHAANSCSPDDLGFGAIDTAPRPNAPDTAQCRMIYQNRGQSETDNMPCYLQKLPAK